ncbi:unnamed protein product [Schistosoma margrebowiei]|uniref:Uncharacterized protein n=1 Tax=Schistosoma margrebowiei TaxID=48269 RepID=A0A3P7X7U8_9TREM|nr:unnamed protein product [Schistosoma margrebowiei]
MDDPLSYTGNDQLYSFTFQINTAGAFRQLDEPINDQPENISDHDPLEKLYSHNSNDDIEKLDSLSKIINKPNHEDDNKMRTDDFFIHSSSVRRDNNNNDYEELHVKPIYHSYQVKRNKRNILSVPKDLTITAEVISGNTDDNINNNKASITYQLKLAAKVEVSLKQMLLF